MKGNFRKCKLLLLPALFMLFETLLTVTCFVSVSPEEYKKWYLLGDRFSNFFVFCGFLRQFLALCSRLFVRVHLSCSMSASPEEYKKI